MKKLILLLAIAGCLTSISAKAQTVNDVKLSDLKEEYIEISVALNQYKGIFLDYGQVESYQSFIVKDDKGKAQRFNTIMAFINLMKTHNYELFQVYVETYGGDSRSKYILKRK